MAKRSISFPDKDLALRDDVKVLGAMVGDVLAEQCGPHLFELVESVREAAIARRENDETDLSMLWSKIEPIETKDSHSLVRAFSAYFQVVNLAERIHRIRRIRQYQRDDKLLPGSLREKLTQLRDGGVKPDEIEQLLERLVIEPVMTAHPTEATRRTLLEKERAMAMRMVERFDPNRTPIEEQTALDRIRQQITAGWQTRSYAAVRPTVDAERKHILFYISEVLYQIVPVYYEAMRRALDETFPGVYADRELPRVLGFGSWVGGDMDGNPNVDHHTLAGSLAEHRRLIIDCYLPETAHLARELSQSLSEVDVSKAVLERIEHYAQQLPAIAENVPERYADMPYRSLMTFCQARLEQVQHDGEFAYRSTDEFVHDLRLIHTSLQQNRGEHAGLFQIDRLIWRIRTFGFHLATLDIRQDAAELRKAVGDLLGVTDWEQQSRTERATQLSAALEKEITIPEAPCPQLTAALAVFRTIDASRKKYGAAAIGSYIISMAQGADDVLSVLLLARAGGLIDADGHIPLDVAPLLETVNDLQAGEPILRELANWPIYKQHLQQRANRQLIMIGYSDSSKDSGIAAARWGLQLAQRQMTDAASELGISLGFFHGRGGTVSRGGGNMVHGIYAAPAGSVNGYLRVTEQGEVIHQKYGIRPLALRNLEQITGATIAATLKSPPDDREGWSEVMSQVAATSRTHFRGLVYDNPDFPHYFRQATPIDVIERLAIGSRPSSRRSKLGIENLRAIPWVFSWAQIRVALPGSFGVGTGLQAAIETHGLAKLQEMLAWPIFNTMINDIEMVLAKSDLEIGRRYSLLADENLRGIYASVEAELQLAEKLILQIKGTDHLLSSDEMLRRAIRLRNPYVDPLNLLQIKLLEQWRAGDRQDDTLLYALFDTVNGIARGIQNTG